MKIPAYLLLGSLAALAVITASQTNSAVGPARRPAAAPLAEVPAYQLPSDNFPAGQQAVDDYAWREFVALNWAASPAYPGQPDPTKTMSTFGQPGDSTASVWGTYKDVADVFRSTVPGPWKDAQYSRQRAGAPKTFNMFSKVQKALLTPAAVTKRLTGGDKGQETPLQALGNWLTDQYGNLIWYEVRLNEDEFNYIVTNKLYDSARQASFARTSGIWLPDGSSSQYGRSGAIEVKASWRVIPASQLARARGRYKIVRGRIPDHLVVKANHKTYYKGYQNVYLGLVGLHIIRKTPNFSQFTWATFEHVDLAPTEGQPVSSTTDYLLFNKNCSAKCGDASPAGCLANQNPQPGRDALTTPIQALRCANAIPDDAAVDGVNSKWQAAIKEANPQSVFQYYRLVSTQWPQAPVRDAAQPQLTPLPVGGITPTTLGNLASETYALQDGCISCHQYGNSMAQKTVGQGTYAADYSFVFGLAKQNVLPAAQAPVRRANSR